ncbi:hypothetical protein Tco_1293183 [Tanacetum coccineum]|uniref:Uncharacterized protein n=1 Tax=Tanacetum coccineum TaxID=301880 RepID=A0ABQ5IMH2_9ASTR
MTTRQGVLASHVTREAVRLAWAVRYQAGLQTLHQSASRAGGLTRRTGSSLISDETTSRCGRWRAKISEYRFALEGPEIACMRSSRDGTGHVGLGREVITRLWSEMDDWPEGWHGTLPRHNERVMRESGVKLVLPGGEDKMSAGEMRCGIDGDGGWTSGEYSSVVIRRESGTGAPELSRLRTDRLQWRDRSFMVWVGGDDTSTHTSSGIVVDTMLDSGESGIGALHQDKGCAHILHRNMVHIRHLTIIDRQLTDGKRVRSVIKVERVVERDDGDGEGGSMFHLGYTTCLDRYKSYRVTRYCEDLDILLARKEDTDLSKNLSLISIGYYQEVDAAGERGVGYRLCGKDGGWCGSTLSGGGTLESVSAAHDMFRHILGRKGHMGRLGYVFGVVHWMGRGVGDFVIGSSGHRVSQIVSGTGMYILVYCA